MNPTHVRHLRNRFSGHEIQSVRPHGPAVGVRLKDTTSSRQQYLVKKEDESNHPANTFRWYLGYRLEDTPPQEPVLLTGAEAIRILCWNPAQAVIGWDQWCLASEVNPSTSAPFSKFIVTPQRQEPCLSDQLVADGQVNTTLTADLTVI